MVRKIDTWSVLKFSSLFFLTFMAVLLLAGIILWLAGSTIGVVESVESFMQAIGFEDFRFVGSQLLRGFVAVGLVIVVLGTGSSVLMSIVYNLISDLVGGIQLTILEEDTSSRSLAHDAGHSDDEAGYTDDDAEYGSDVAEPPVADAEMAPPARDVSAATTPWAHEAPAPRAPNTGTATVDDVASFDSAAEAEHDRHLGSEAAGSPSLDQSDTDDDVASGPEQSGGYPERSVAGL